MTQPAFFPRDGQKTEVTSPKTENLSLSLPFKNETSITIRYEKTFLGNDDAVPAGDERHSGSGEKR